MANAAVKAVGLGKDYLVARGRGYRHAPRQAGNGCSGALASHAAGDFPDTAPPTSCML